LSKTPRHAPERPQHPYTQRLLDSEPSGDPVPLPVNTTPLLSVTDLPFRSRYAKAYCGALSMKSGAEKHQLFLRPEKRWGWSANRVGKSTTGLALLRLIASGDNPV
jgi:microcin C transport system ATP-binding protein